MIARRLYLPTLLLLVACSVAAMALYEPDGEDPTGVGVGVRGGPAETTGPALAGSAQSGSGREVAKPAAAEPMIDALPRGLPAWGLAVHLVRGKGVERGPAGGITVRVALEGPEGTLFERSGVSDGAGLLRLAALELPAVPRRLFAALTLVVRAEEQGDGSFPDWRRALFVLAPQIRKAAREGGMPWVRVTLVQRSGRRIRGRLLTSSGHPVQGVWISTKPYSSGDGMTPTGWDGEFEIRLSADAHIDTALEAEASGAFKIQQVESLDFTTLQRGVEIRLPRAGEVSGRVRDATGKALAGVHLVLSRPWWKPNNFALHYSGGLPQAVSRLQTHSDEDGRFAFPGLVAGEAYVLWWPGDDGPWERLPAPVYRGNDDLQVVVARHRFRPRLVDARTGKATYGETVIRRGRQGEKSPYVPLRHWDAMPNEAGRIAAPGDHFVIHGWARGYGVSTLEYAMPTVPGTHDAVLALEPLEAGPVLRLRFVDGEGASVEGLPFFLKRPLEHTHESLPLEVPREGDEGGWLRLEDLPPGPLTLATPERMGHPPKGKWRFTLPLEVSLVIPETGTLERKVQVPQGGSVRIFFHRPAGRDSGRLGELTLRHRSGVEESPWWYARGKGGAWTFEHIDSGRFEPDDRVFESSVLIPGAWTLAIEASEAYRAVSRALRLRAGEVTEVHVTLESLD